MQRFVLITSIGCGSSSSAPPHAPHEAYKSHEPALLQADRAEVRLRTVAGDFGMGFTILRPGDLSDAPASGTAMLTEDASAWVVGHAISRADVGRLAADALFSDHARGRTLSVVDPGRAHGEPRPAAFQL